MVGAEISTEWKTTEKRFVAFIDIMGFKDMVARQAHHKIYDMMKRVNELKTVNSSVAWEKKPDLVRTTTYSDSIMVYSKNDSSRSYYSFNCTVSAIINDLFLEEIPHKGAVAYGLMTLDTENSIFFGQPLIDAYTLQDQLLFYGIVMHSSAEEKIDSSEYRETFCHQFNCTFKGGTSYHNTIFPMSAFVHQNDDEKDFQHLLSSINRLKYKTSGYLRRYIDNTLSYINDVRESFRSELNSNPLP